MVAAHAQQVYRQTAAVNTGIDPVKLIHLMYERLLVHFRLVEEGIESKNPQKRGENLGKAIAIVTELLASINSEDDSDAAEFLRGLYGAILTELPKVSLGNDIGILHQATRYVERLKEIWEQTAMQEKKSAAEKNVAYDQSVTAGNISDRKNKPVSQGKDGKKTGLSVAI
ncbi:MAG: flagellar export chaperone FliS [Proteobacteria bacterium]|nr:flagellar export chaperone FliS [Pseudomonadota bacterium]MBU1710254.1 flagellar export chaperone FliS [Pseudomonadota bacterium]